MGGGFVVEGPVACESLIRLAPEQEIELFREDTVYLFAEHLIEIGHHPAAELEALCGIFLRRTRCLHDSIHGNLGADNDFPHNPTAVRLCSRILPPAPCAAMPSRSTPRRRRSADREW